MEVTLDDILVMHVVSPSGPHGASEGFKKLEDGIDWQLKGRKFYGTMLHDEYRSCLAILNDDEPKRLGFPTWTIPGGKYLKARMIDWNKHIPEIAPAFGEMQKGVTVDESRPEIEFYKSFKELILFVPIK